MSHSASTSAKRSLPSSPSPHHPQERHLTLLLQCHGAIYRNRVVSSNNVTVYSLVGAPGFRAETGISFNPQDKGQSSDFLLGTVVHDVYRYEIHKKPEISHKDLLGHLTEPLKDLYTDCDISYPRGYEIRENPKEYRKFYFHPNEHENCRSCVHKGNRRCSYSRTFGSRTGEEDIVWCPEYGIFPILSSDDSDYTHTVVSIGEKERAGVKSPLSKSRSNVPDDTVFIKQKNIIGEAAQTYWRNKILNNPDLQSNPLLRTKMLVNFDTLCSKRELHINRLINIFQLGMGYTHLYFIDPSCRDYMKSDDEAISQEQMRANPRTRWHHAIDSTLQQVSQSRSRSRSAAGETITPACVYTQRKRPRKDSPDKGNGKHRCVIMGGRHTQRRRRRGRKSRERRRR
jgi:hypothetical protein